MKYVILAIFLYATATLDASWEQDNPLDVDKFLAAVAQVETGGDYTQIGAHGERSEYQFMRATWVEYTDVPFALASTHNGMVQIVAKLHAMRLQAALRERKVDYYTHPLNVATAWNRGAGAVNGYLINGHPDYAVRVGNLYNTEK